MTSFVVLGSSRFAPYEILAVPNKIAGATNDDTGYDVASKIFHPRIEAADVIIVFAPGGIGEHTQRDIDYAKNLGKMVWKLVPLLEDMREDPTVINEQTLNDSLQELRVHEREVDTLQFHIGRLRKYIEQCMDSLEYSRYRHAGYNLFWRKNSPSHSLNWSRLRKDHEELYTFLMEHGIATIREPRSEQSLVFTTSEEADP